MTDAAMPAVVRSLLAEIDDHPDDVSVRLQAAGMLVQQGYPAEAIGQCTVVLKQEAGNAEARALLSEATQQLIDGDGQRRADSSVHPLTAGEANGSSVAVSVSYASCLAEEERSYRDRLAADPGNDELLIGLSRVLGLQRHGIEAAEVCFAALRINPGNERAVDRLLWVWRLMAPRVSLWRSAEPDSRVWDVISTECPPAVDDACRGLRCVIAESRARVEWSLGRVQDVIGAVLGAHGVIPSQEKHHEPRARTWKPVTTGLRTEEYQNRDWSLLGYPEAPVRGEPLAIGSVTFQLRMAGRQATNTSELYETAASTATAADYFDNFGLREISATIHAEAARVGRAYEVCAEALTDLQDAMTRAITQTTIAQRKVRQAAELEESRVQRELDGEYADAVRDKIVARFRAQGLPFNRPNLVQLDAQEDQAGQDAVAQARGAILAESGRRLDSEQQTAVEQARLAIDALGQTQAWCAAAINAAVTGRGTISQSGN